MDEIRLKEIADQLKSLADELSGNETIEEESEEESEEEDMEKMPPMKEQEKKGKKDSKKINIMLAFLKGKKGK